jgi:phosphohistidine swiveling domain-containing protein
MLKMVNPHIVFVGQVEGAMKKLEEHLIVTLDGTEKTVYEGNLD